MCSGTSSGRLSQIFHFGPLIAIFLISFITSLGFICLVQWWPADMNNDPLSVLHMSLYLTWPIIIFYNYFNAVFLGPGFVPYQWKPENKEAEAKLQYCKICKAFKAPRSHHCRKCKRCVMKMDHHCPWINTCCGHLNHASFVYFLFFAPLGCIHALIVLASSIYRAVFLNYYMFYNINNVPHVNLSFIELISCIFAAGMALGVSIAVSILLYVQLKSIWYNQTGIENWIVKKAEHRRGHNTDLEPFNYPYNLGTRENIRQVLNWSFRPIGNGIWWNVASGSDQYSLTDEQILQKVEKENHSVQYLVKVDYAGTFLPMKFGCKTFCCIPWSEEPRIVLLKNELVQVTRWQKQWLYGEVKIDDSKFIRKVTKGWFPAKSVQLNETPESIDKKLK